MARSVWKMTCDALCFSPLLALSWALVLPQDTVRKVDVGALPPVPGRQVINIADHGPYSEPSLAINPNKPNQLVLGFMLNAGVAYSEDAGRHWTRGPNIAPPDFKFSGDVSVTFDNRGHAILCYIAFNQLGSYYLGKDPGRNGVFIRRSLDGGKSWEKAIAIREQPERPGVPFEDKPYILADNSSSPYAGNLYLGWSEFSLTKSIILFSRSTNGGSIWSEPIAISTQEGLPRDANGAVEGFAGAVGPDGTVYVAWGYRDGIVFTSSRDGGQSFAPALKIIDTTPDFFDIQNVARGNGFPQVAIDPREGRLFVTWSDYRNGDIDIFSSTSLDHGQSWSAPVRVNSDPPHNGADQFLQWLAVDPMSGAANVIFYDREVDPQENLYANIVLARSTDGGRTFTNYNWTKKPFSCGGAFLGDYTALAAFGGKVYGSWTTTTNKSTQAENSFIPKKSRSHQSMQGLGGDYTAVQVGIGDFGYRSTQ